MSNPLVPERRINKNGVSVVKHVRAGQKTGANSSSLPAPVIEAPATKKLNPPTPRQLARVGVSRKAIQFQADDDLVKALGSKGSFTPLPSEVELFGLFSVVSPDNALAFASVGIEDPDKAIEVLEQHGLTHLMVDRRDLMDEAISKRVKTDWLLSLSRNYDLDAYDTDLLLDAALLAGSRREVPLNGETGGQRLHDSLLRGNISHEDVKAYSITALKDQLTNTSKVHHALIARHNGTASHSVKTIKHVNHYVRFNGDFLPTLQLAETHGNNFLCSITTLYGALRVEEQYADQPKEYRQALMKYQDAALSLDTDSKFKFLQLDGIADLYNHQVPPSYIHDLLQQDQNIPADAIIKAHTEGVGAEYIVAVLRQGRTIQDAIEASHADIKIAVSDGWL